MTDVTILVCTTCRQAGEATEGGERLGARLHAALGAALDGAGDDTIRIQPVECLSVCKRPVTIGFAAPGRWTYIYGDFGPEAAPEILATAQAYARAPEGLIPWRERPQAFRKGVVARVPPFPNTAVKEAAE